MAWNTWWLYHGGSISCDHMVFPKGLSNVCYRNIQAQRTIWYRNKRYLPLTDRCSYELVIFFKSIGSKKHSQHLRIQPSEYVASPRLSGGERERARESGICPLRERTILLGSPLHSA
jgi:hypothetical protein